MMQTTIKGALRVAALIILLTGAGCGGFSGSHSVSPASFFIPGADATSGQPKLRVSPSQPMAQNQPVLNPIL